MVSYSDFRLINELYDNLALLDSKLKPVFQGKILRELLLRNHFDLAKSGSKDSTENVLIKQLNKAHLSIKEKGLPESIVIPGIAESFLLVPATDGNYYFGKKKEILHFVKMKHDLRERVKELTCLYSISSESESIADFDTFFDKCISIIKAGFQYPGDTVINIKVNDKMYGDADWMSKEVMDYFSSDILVNKQKKGEVRVCVTKGFTILDEEKRLVDEIANNFGKILEQKEKKDSLEKQKKVLTAKNEALFRITEECGQKREELKTFIRAISARIVVIDRDFNILMANKDELTEGSKCYSRMFGRDTRCDECPALTTFATSADSDIRKRVNDRHFTITTHPIYGSDNKVDRVLEVCRDVTDRIKMESQMFQSYKLASLGKLVAGVAHEINNPNTFILGNLKIVQEAFDDIFPILDKHFEDNKDLRIARLNYQVFRDNISILIKDMVNGASRTKKIVEDLRNFAKKDVEQLNEDLDLNYIINNHLTLTEKHVKKRARLEIELGENIPIIKGNSNKIEQVFLNLIMNASEAIENGNGVIKIKTAYDEAKKEVQLYISDNGNGIDETIVKNIFDPFFTTKRDRGGIGLGLSITYGIVKEHGGKIEVESKRGVGTTFIIKFPVGRQA